MRMSARRFFLLHKYIKRIRARSNYDLWLMVNWRYITDQKFKDEVFKEMTETAFPENGSQEDKWWENVKPGLHLVV